MEETMVSKSAKKTKGQTGRKAKKRNSGAVSTATDQGGTSTPARELSGKDYERELKKLHVELVKLQQWVVDKGLKVCIVFEGRDGAGKGGTIKAITERESPRVFRVVGLTAPTQRQKYQK
jgi:polyphosphate kinase 2 (PPK2 family)